MWIWMEYVFSVYLYGEVVFEKNVYKIFGFFYFFGKVNMLIFSLSVKYDVVFWYNENFMIILVNVI